MRRMLWIVVALLAICLLPSFQGCSTVAQAGEGEKQNPSPVVAPTQEKEQIPAVRANADNSSTEELLNLSGDEEGGEQKPATEGTNSGNAPSGEQKHDNPTTETNNGNPPAPKVLMTDEEFERRVAALQEHWRKIDTRVAAIKLQFENLPAEQLVKFEQIADETDAEVESYPNEKIPALVKENDAVPAAAKAGKLAELAEWFEGVRKDLFRIIGK